MAKEIDHRSVVKKFLATGVTVPGSSDPCFTVPATAFLLGVSPPTIRKYFRNLVQGTDFCIYPPQGKSRAYLFLSGILKLASTISSPVCRIVLPILREEMASQEREEDDDSEDSDAEEEEEEDLSDAPLVPYCDSSSMRQQQPQQTLLSYREDPWGDTVALQSPQGQIEFLEQHNPLVGGAGTYVVGRDLVIHYNSHNDSHRSQQTAFREWVPTNGTWLTAAAVAVAAALILPVSLLLMLSDQGLSGTSKPTLEMEKVR